MFDDLDNDEEAIIRKEDEKIVKPFPGVDMDLSTKEKGKNMLQRITNMGPNNEGFLHKFVEICAKKCDAYIARGKLELSDIPTTKAELKALYDDTMGDAPFLPLGAVDGSGNGFKWTANKHQLEYRQVTLNYTVSGTIVAMNVTPEMLEFANSMKDDEYSILYIPKGEDDTFAALSGVSINHEGDFKTADSAPSNITFQIETIVNKLSEAIIYRKLVA